jgi:hypothetical protein
MERPLGKRHHARVRPVGDIDIVIREQRTHRVAKKRGVVSRQRRHQQQFRLLARERSQLAPEMQQPAEGLFDHDALGDRDPRAVDHGVGNAERRFFVVLREPVENFGTGGQLAARGKIGERAERVGEEIQAGFGNGIPRRESGELKFM